MPWKTKFAKFASPRRGACGGLCLDTCGPLLIRILTEAARRQMRHCKRANHGHSRHPVPSAAHWTRCTHPCDDAKFASPRRGACGGGYGTFAWTHVTAADTHLKGGSTSHEALQACQSRQIPSWSLTARVPRRRTDIISGAIAQGKTHDYGSGLETELLVRMLMRVQGREGFISSGSIKDTLQVRVDRTTNNEDRFFFLFICFYVKKCNDWNN